MSAVEVRSTTPADLAPLGEVLREVYELDGCPVEGVVDPQAWLRLTQPIGQWTALHLGHVGLLMPDAQTQAVNLAKTRELGPDGISVVARLFVSPSARGLGIGRRLLNSAQKMSEETGRVATLDVMAKDKAAIALYASLGWRVIWHIDHSYGEDQYEPALIMMHSGPTSEEGS